MMIYAREASTAATGIAKAKVGMKMPACDKPFAGRKSRGTAGL